MEGNGVHNPQKPNVGTLVQGWTKNPCFAAGLRAYMTETRNDRLLSASYSLIQPLRDL